MRATPGIHCALAGVAAEVAPGMSTGTLMVRTRCVCALARFAKPLRATDEGLEVDKACTEILERLAHTCHVCVRGKGFARRSQLQGFHLRLQRFDGGSPNSTSPVL